MILQIINFDTQATRERNCKCIVRNNVITISILQSVQQCSTYDIVINNSSLVDKNKFLLRKVNLSAQFCFKKKGI